MASVPNAAPDATHRESPRILVLEDEFMLTRDLERVLQRLGATTVGPFPDVGHALEATAHEHFDVALVDIRLRHGTTGEAVARELHRRHVPVLVVTGYGDDALAEDVRTLPRLTKPFSDAEAERRIRTLLPTA